MAVAAVPSPVVRRNARRPLGRLDRVRLTIGRRVAGRREGDHASLLAGRGLEPGEARPYVPGDDVRRLDWSLLARTGEAHVRVAIAERDLDVGLLVDLSGSMDFGTAGWRKADLARSVATAVATLAGRGRDRVGAVVLGADGPVGLPARSGRDGIAALIARLETIPVGGDRPLAEGLERLGRSLRRRGLAVVVTDLVGSTGGRGPTPARPAPALPTDWRPALTRLARRHDTIVVEIVDPRELALPDAGELVLEDPESGVQRSVDTADPALRLAYARAAAARRDALAATVRGCGAAHIRVRTDRDWVGPLLGFLEARRRGRATGRPVAPTGDRR